MITAKRFIALLSASAIYGAASQSTSVHSTPSSSTTSATPGPTHPINVLHNFTDMKALFDGNTKSRSTTKVTASNFTSTTPAFMFLGCSDNRISSGAIFNAPAGSIVSQNNIGNQYSEKDLATQSALAYAIQDLKVKHVLVLGHDGCKGVQTAITSSHKPTTSMQKWVKPIIDIFVHSKRKEINVLRDLRKPQRNKKNMVTATPKADNPGFKALVEENVKQSVERIKKQSVLATAYKKKSFQKNEQEEFEVFVHGLVYDDSNGEVKNLRVSFGPRGKTIPDIPFSVVQAAKNWHGPLCLVSTRARSPGLSRSRLPPKPRNRRDPVFSVVLLAP